MQTFQNPILKGFSPDPSICVVGDDYYLVTSTFSYFPGVPIYHSKDLVNWELIGNILDRKSQLPLSDVTHSQGIFAPSIRYNKGIFYMITTNVPNGGNFIVTATDPTGPWSDPYYLEGAAGIDPSLFFDTDGKSYYVGTRPNPKGVRYNGDWEVWLQEIDLKSMKLIGVSTKLWKGALREAIWPEGPHLYKRNGYYYLMIAEGGTSFEHCVTIARSEKIDGPYIGNPCNPILTHRHLGRDYPVCNVGHGDLVETADGQWYMTCLASRIFDGYSNLGRETFLAEVVWESDWPVINPGLGRLAREQMHRLPLFPTETVNPRILFEQPLDKRLLFLRNPDIEKYVFDERDGWLRMYASPHTIADIASPSYIGIRQQSMWYTLKTRLDFTPQQNGDEAGLVILQNDRYSIRFVSGLFDGKRELRVITNYNGEEKLEERIVEDSRNLTLKIRGDCQKLHFYYSQEDGEEIEVVKNIDAHILSTEVAGGFVGCTMGVYATSKSDLTNSCYADFQWLEQVNEEVELHVTEKVKQYE
ncbi:glycoside hydrolase 43 family protein [Niallia circulans]|uniref:glycoside hydrolase family 43 protein n=1 Tax=Niallia circulans TaxID=1397 RepID=UPI00201D6BD1|nr:glycoside hydrolase family 43 protein [Niallia circulans]UQZ77664.1 glycoside hydrolase 43 family protein [Niallia circulans]